MVTDAELMLAIDTVQTYLQEQIPHDDCGAHADDMHWTCAGCRAAMLSRELYSFRNQVEEIGPISETYPQST